jgi:tRNA modification GTPase
MSNRPYVSDLICAESSPGGNAGVSVIRVSGDDAINLFNEIFADHKTLECRKVYFKKYRSKQNIFLDEVITFSFEDQKSFTGEPCFEIQCHGSPLVVQSILEDICDRGARLAEPGEFSYRAYLNKKIDLVKAESIHHLIHSQSNKVREMSLNLLEGKFNKDLEEIKESLLLALSRLEAVIDFSEQDIDLEQEDVITSALKKASALFDEYLSSFKYSNVHLEGIKVSLLGPPNSGKSSLFNKLLSFDRSIISETAGTTRDYISETTFLDDFSFKLVDTAGLRDSDDSIEEKGIKRSLELADKSQVILLLVSEDTLEDFYKILNQIEGPILKKSILIKTKKDISEFDFTIIGVPSIEISTFSDSDLELLKVKLKEALLPFFNINKNLFVERQHQLLKNSYCFLNEAQQIQLSGHEDIISSLLYKSLSLVDEVLYIDDPEAVRNKIFNDFCLGK